MIDDVMTMWMGFVGRYGKMAWLCGMKNVKARTFFRQETLIFVMAVRVDRRDK